MRLMISILLVFTFSLSKAQSSNTVARTEEYVVVIAYEKALGNLNMKFSLDYGEDLPPSMTADMVKDENKKLERFKSIVDVLNLHESKRVGVCKYLPNEVALRLILSLLAKENHYKLNFLSIPFSRY
jgi:hypothetical protein